MDITGFPYFFWTKDGFRTHEDRYTDPTSVAEFLKNLPVWAENQQLDLLLLPELMVDAQALENLEKTMTKLPLVVAGSRHPMAACGNEEYWYFPAKIFAGNNPGAGWVHRKAGCFSLTGDDIIRMQHYFRGSLDGIEAGQRYGEYINGGTCLRFTDTPFGRIVVLICADLLDGTIWAERVKELAPELVLVVSMSDKSEAFLRKLAGFENTDFLYVNAAGVAKGKDRWDRILAFVHLSNPPARPMGASTPQSLPETWVWIRDAGLQRYLPDHQLVEETAPAWISLDPFGMVVDIGAALGFGNFPSSPST